MNLFLVSSDRYEYRAWRTWRKDNVQRKSSIFMTLAILVHHYTPRGVIRKQLPTAMVWMQPANTITVKSASKAKYTDGCKVTFWWHIIRCDLQLPCSETGKMLQKLANRNMSVCRQRWYVVRCYHNIGVSINSWWCYVSESFCMLTIFSHHYHLKVNQCIKV
jgi:hypothetical protein